jgi:hypothetical protein
LNPSSGFLRGPLSWAQLMNGDPTTALETLDRPENKSELRELLRPTVLDALGRHAQANREQAEAEKKFGRDAPMWLALLYVSRRDNNKAFAWLERALQTHEEDLVSLQADPGFAALRTDSRFHVLLRKMKIPE